MEYAIGIVTYQPDLARLRENVSALDLALGSGPNADVPDSAEGPDPSAKSRAETFSRRRARSGW